MRTFLVVDEISTKGHFFPSLFDCLEFLEKNNPKAYIFKRGEKHTKKTLPELTIPRLFYMIEEKKFEYEPSEEYKVMDEDLEFYVFSLVPTKVRVEVVDFNV